MDGEGGRRWGALTPDAAEVALERGVEEIHLRRFVAVGKPGVEAEEDPRVEVEGSLHDRRRCRPELGQQFARVSSLRSPRQGFGGCLRGVVWEEEVQT